MEKKIAFNTTFIRGFESLTLSLKAREEKLPDIYKRNFLNSYNKDIAKNGRAFSELFSKDMKVSKGTTFLGSMILEDSDGEEYIMYLGDILSETAVYKSYKDHPKLYYSFNHDIKSRKTQSLNDGKSSQWDWS